MRRLLLTLALLVLALPSVASADLEAYVGQFSTGTGAVSSTISVTGVGFQPKVIIPYWSGRTDTVDAAGGLGVRLGMGFCVSSSDHRAIASGGTDGAATSSTGSASQNDDCVLITASASNNSGGASLTSMDSDGFTLTVTTQFAASYTIQFLALGGSDITNVATGGATSGTTTGTVALTGVGFEPDSVLFLSVGERTTEGFGTGAAMGLGALVCDTLDQASVNVGMQHNVTTPNTSRYGRSGDGLVILRHSGTLAARANITACGSDGWTYNFTTAAVSRQYYWLAIKGARFAVQSFLTQTDTTTDISVTLGLQPSAVLVLSHTTTESSEGTPQDHAELSIGASTGADTGQATAILDEDKSTVTSTETASAIDVDKVYVNISTADAVEGVMNLRSVSGTGVTFRMSDADPAQAFGFVWAVAATGGGGGVIGRGLGPGVIQ